MNLQDIQAFHLDREEHLMLTFRKHWFVFLSEALGSILAVFLPLLILVALKILGFDATADLPPHLISFVSLWWLLIVWLALMALWTNYYLDM